MSFNVFVSYAHADNEHVDPRQRWCDRLMTHLKPLTHLCKANVWKDTARIGVGARWGEIISSSVASCNVAVLLISPSYLASEFIVSSELPVFLRRAMDSNDRLSIIPVLISHSLFSEPKWTFEYIDFLRETKSFSLSSIMAANPLDKPLVEMSEGERDRTLSRIATQILRIGEVFERLSERSDEWRRKATERDLSRLPQTVFPLCGRKEELRTLDEALRSPDISVCSVIARGGGEGKSALVNEWLGTLLNADVSPADTDAHQDEFTPVKAFAWSFHSQGRRDDRGSADDFVQEALRFFGERDTNLVLPREKGKYLAEKLQEHHGLLILDGLEPLQQHRRKDYGCLKDDAVDALLRALITRSSSEKRTKCGFCVVTSRVPLPATLAKGSAATAIPLQLLSVENGAEVLSLAGAEGSQEELRFASADFRGHPLTLTLVAGYVRDLWGGNIGRRYDIPDREWDRTHGHPVDRILACYELRFQGRPELDVLRMIGLFDRPATYPEIACLREGVISGLTDNIAKVKNPAQWDATIRRLRRAGLFSGEDPAAPKAIDAHPLVRDYFKRRLSGSEGRMAWQEGHRRLYRYWKSATHGDVQSGEPAGSNDSSAEELNRADALNALLPLYRAVAHACRAGGEEANKALKRIYWDRIQQGRKGFAHRRLGAFSSELGMLAVCFKGESFDVSDPHLIDGLSPFWQATVFGTVGSRLRAIGRLDEAVQFMQESLKRHDGGSNYLFAAVQSRHLAELYMELGQLEKARKAAKEAVKLADRLKSKGKRRRSPWKRNRYVAGAGTNAERRAAFKQHSVYERVVERCVLASILHQLNERKKARKYFRKAERILRKAHGKQGLDRLFTLWGFRYCEYLLDAVERTGDRRKRQRLMRKLRKRIKRMESQQGAVNDLASEGDLGIGPALGNLAKLRAQVTAGKFTRQALEAAKSTVKKLHSSKRTDFNAGALITEARILAKMGRFRDAIARVNDAEKIALDGKMALQVVDCQLEFGAVVAEAANANSEEAKAVGDEKEAAIEKLEQAGQSIEDMKYKRRSHELKRIRGLLRS